ncbi:MAG TPA: hypothetical protein VLJ62_33755, partial [Burkholderiaceae bacterium]|nr:hypothetical protein [Burkholderiaceae bacterium]
INFAIVEMRFAAAARLRGYWLGSFVRRGFTRAVTKRFVEQSESAWGPTLQANLDDSTIERLGAEGQTFDAEAVCALTMEIADRPP